ncbi:hypothetical protein CTheo_8371 [Ceratobasidium theobromae]|uniref:Uncharacterized protein n=1 Tax=Ceratobasidium theobromae TaxID=1582974 RepID=A0A5N5Q935_9AGAM|nr:hypothetical protein CTheo_8371 [Ceratobasidium theobromae]
MSTPISTTFTRRIGTHQFSQVTQTNGWTSLVNNWHKNVYDQRDVVYEPEEVRDPNRSRSDPPEWKVIPIIMGERHPQYEGRGGTIAIAKAVSAKKIAESGHCVSSFQFSRFLK